MGSFLSSWVLHGPSASSCSLVRSRWTQPLWAATTRNRSTAQRTALAGTGRGPVAQAAVAGATDREANQVVATGIQSTDAETLQGFVVVDADS